MPSRSPESPGRARPGARATRSRAAAFALWALASGLVSCGDEAGPAGAEPLAATPGLASHQAATEPYDSSGPPLAILLVTIDTTRADAIGCYGGRARTPVIDRLAREGVLFRNVSSPVPVTHPAHTSLLTGLYPIHHGVRDNGLFALDPAASTLAEIFRSGGWRTAAFVSSVVLAARHGLDQGFDHYDDALRAEAGPNNVMERTADVTVRRTTAYIETVPARDRLFLWVHLFDPHAPFTPPEPFASEYPADPYLGEVAFADQQTGKLVAAFRSRWPHSLVIVTSDHGDALGHREPNHGLLLTEETMHIPLVMVGPGLPAGREVTSPASLLDLFPTLLELAGLDPPDGIDAASLTDLIDGGRRREPIFLETLLPYYTFGWSARFGVRQNRLKYVIGSATSGLYDLSSDPGESHDRSADHPDEMLALSRLLETFLAQPPRFAPRPITVDREAREALEALGYLSAPRPTKPSTELLVGPDPSRMAAALQQHLDADAMISAGRYGEARGLLESLLAKDPTNHFLHQSYGRLLALTGEYVKARHELEIALNARPDRANASFFLGICYEGEGQLDKAEEAYRAVIEVAPENAPSRFQLAELLWRQNRKEEARTFYRAYLALNPSNEEKSATARERLEE